MSDVPSNLASTGSAAPVVLPSIIPLAAALEFARRRALRSGSRQQVVAARGGGWVVAVSDNVAWLRLHPDGENRVECTCAMTEASMKPCKVHGYSDLEF